LAYYIKDSKFGGDCLYMQIEMKNTKYLLWTGSTGLMKAIKQVPRGEKGFPFTTTIIEENEKYLFT